MSKTLTGAALKANRRKVLIQTATDAMTDGHPDAIVALLTEAEKARPTRNPEPLRPEVREALHFEQLCQRYGFIDSWDDDASHAAEERRHQGAWFDLAEDEGRDLPVMGG